MMASINWGNVSVPATATWLSDAKTAAHCAAQSPAKQAVSDAAAALHLASPLRSDISSASDDMFSLPRTPSVHFDEYCIVSDVWEAPAGYDRAMAPETMGRLMQIKERRRQRLMMAASASPPQSPQLKIVPSQHNNNNSKAHQTSAFASPTSSPVPSPETSPKHSDAHDGLAVSFGATPPRRLAQN
eukprot:PhM_4_TR5753/c0_g1_i1/m.35061